MFTVDRSINFDGLDSFSDFGVVVQTASIGLPAKNKNRIQIPNTSIYYDYATVFGDVYAERTLEYTFLICNINAMTTEELEHEKLQLAKWLMPGSQHELRDSVIPNYHFTAEVQNGPEYTDNIDYGLFKVNFTCYPFRIRDGAEGDDIWDTFDFDNDVAQDTSFSVNGTISILLINVGVQPVSPELVVTGTVAVKIGEVSKTLITGTYTDTGLVLAIGENSVSLSGSGTITFIWHKELI